MDKYIIYNDTKQFYKELTNIVLISIEETGDCYCYCGEENGTCGICELAIFLTDPHDQNKIEGLSARKFLVKNRENQEKLQVFADKIVVFFDKIQDEKPESLEFFEKEYRWSLKSYSTGETFTLTLDDCIDNEILRYDDETYEHDFYS